ncbi:MAG: DUF664 domain-containing protein [Caldilineaceae bacterium]|nr:DUF664 domain-containing protein [Caldilineaceae bacterium]
MPPYFKDYLDLFEIALGEIEAAIRDLSVEALNWSPGAEMNSMAVLVAHTVGSSRYWVGDVAANDASDRNRASEFAVQALDEAELQQRIATLRQYLRTTLANLSIDELDQERAARSFSDEPVSMGWALLHALEHASTHVGHLQIMRQLVNQQAAA